MKPKVVFTFLLIGSFLSTKAQPVVILNSEKTGELGLYCSILEDPTSKLSISDVIEKQDQFKISTSKVPTSIPTLSAFWLRFQVRNMTGMKYYFEIDNPPLDAIDLYKVSGDEAIHLKKSGDALPFSNRDIKTNNFIFKVDLPKGETQTFYLRYTGTEGLQMPFKFATSQVIIEKSHERDLAHGIYYGILIVTILNNLLLYLMLRDKSFLYYVLYITFFCFLQATLLGHAFEFLWPGLPWFANQGIFLFSGLAGIFAIQFVHVFLQAQQRVPRLYTIGIFLQFVWGASILLSLMSKLLPDKVLLFNQFLVSLSGMLFSLYVIGMAVTVYRQGYRGAKFFLLAWIIFLMGIVIYVIKADGLLPHNIITNNTMQIGSAIEAILLSLALGHRYSLLKREKEIMKDQLNKELELNQGELKKINKQLLKTNKDLDNFVYTASHDLKAPISNLEGLIYTLKEDRCYEELQTKPIIDMMELSIEKFRNTIHDLTEITKIHNSLIDDVEINDIKEAVEEIKFNLQKLIQDSGAEIRLDLQIPTIRFSKKNLRSLLYNLISNGIKYRSAERKPELIIRTEQKSGFVILSVSDNGLGIRESIKDKIFLMFKRGHDHVQGSGIGLYIVKRIMENEGGRIVVESEEGKGSSFKLFFPSAE